MPLPPNKISFQISNFLYKLKNYDARILYFKAFAETYQRGVQKNIQKRNISTF